MVQRTVKLMGTAYTTGSPVNVQVSYNGAEVINTGVTADTVSAIPLPAAATGALVELAIFETTTDITGQIPVTISVSGGTVFFAHFWMNYSGAEYARQAADPGVPIDPADPSTFVQVVAVQTGLHYSDPNTNTVESDGISNLTKNGSPWPWRTNVNDLIGDWRYPINTGETVTFDFFVDPAKIVLV